MRWLERGLLLEGPSAAGKSGLVARLLAAGARLIADDLVILERHGARLIARAPAPPGALELRGHGLIRLAASPATPIDLLVTLQNATPSDRLPEVRLRERLGVSLPATVLVGTDAAALARLACILHASPVEPR